MLFTIRHKGVLSDKDNTWGSCIFSIVSQVEHELKTVVITQESDNDERYRRLQQELQHEREHAHKQIYERSTEIEHLRISMSSQEQEIKRLRREIEALEAKLNAQQPSSHSSSLILTTKKQPSDVQLVVPSQSK